MNNDFQTNYSLISIEIDQRSPIQPSSLTFKPIDVLGFCKSTAFVTQRIHSIFNCFELIVSRVVRSKAET